MRVRLTADCTGPWEINDLRVIRGEVPPGIFFNGKEFTGIPRRIGSWRLHTRVEGPTCDGVVYRDKDVYLTFHIQGNAPRRGR